MNLSRLRSNNSWPNPESEDHRLELPIAMATCRLAFHLTHPIIIPPRFRLRKVLHNLIHYASFRVRATFSKSRFNCVHRAAVREILRGILYALLVRYINFIFVTVRAGNYYATLEKFFVGMGKNVMPGILPTCITCSFNATSCSNCYVHIIANPRISSKLN